jgi:hypothetical protein
MHDTGESDARQHCIKRMPLAELHKRRSMLLSACDINLHNCLQ